LGPDISLSCPDNNQLGGDMKLKLFLAAALVGLIALIAQPRPVHPQTSLVGSWQLTLTESLPAGDTPILFPGLANFTSDGGATAAGLGDLAGPTTIAAGSPPPGFTQAFGNWNGGPTPGHAVFKLVSYIQNPDGAIAGTRTFQALVAPQSDAGQFTGSYTVTIVGSNNNIIFSGSGTISGTLISHFLPPSSTQN
jgi:hypothetical protein